MSNFTHTLVKNEKEIQIFELKYVRIFSIILLFKQSGNPSTIMPLQFIKTQLKRLRTFKTYG